MPERPEDVTDTEASGPSPPPVGWGPVFLVAAGLAALAGLLAARATLDPPVPDASDVLTDTDGTTYFDPEDGGLDAGLDDAPAAER